MRTQKIQAVILLAILSVFSFYAMVSGWFSMGNAAEKEKNPEEILSEKVPEPFKKALFQLSYLLGNTEKGDIFLTENALLKDFPKPREKTVEKNTDYLKQFAETGYAPTHVMLIPTACAIKQNELSPFVPLYDQKELIETAYQSLMGSATTVDAYSVLYANRNQYLYYRTQDELTGLGGYYLYAELTGRLGISERKKPLSDFTVEYAKEKFYGELYQQVRYHNVLPDTVCFYENIRQPLSVSVYHINETEEEREDRIYFPERLDNSGKTDYILNGLSPKMELWNNAASYQEQLLLFGDETVKSYLPFLLGNYARITFLDLNHLSVSALENLDFSQYSQILFACDTKTFSQTDFTALKVLV